VIDAATRAAWRHAHYRVHDGAAWIDTRIGVAHPAIAALLARHDAGIGALVTGCNPRGRQLDDAANRRRLDALATQLAAAGYRCFAAEGASPTRDWVEPSLFVPGLGGATCASVMHAHDQLAWLEYDAQGHARLCESGLAQHDGVAG
jgi:hypothetical protein